MNPLIRIPDSVLATGTMASENSFPNSSRMRGARESAAGLEMPARPSRRSSKATCGCARAMFVTISTMCRSSVAALFRNFLRAGTLQKRSRTVISVPGAHPAGLAESAFETVDECGVRAVRPGLFVIYAGFTQPTELSERLYGGKCVSVGVNRE